MQRASALAAAWLCVTAGGAAAQTASSALDPFAPVPLTQNKLPNFDKLPSSPPPPAKPRSTLLSVLFAPPVSAAGKTGFDSTNARKKRRPRANPGSRSH
jgi:hypothetical protein